MSTSSWYYIIFSGEYLILFCTIYMLALFYTIEDEFHEIISSNVYSDVRYMGSHNQVSGGYLYTYKWDNSGKKNFTIKEKVGETWVTATKIEIKLKDKKKAEDEWLQGLLEIGIDKVSALVEAALTAANVNSAMHSLVIDGIFTGVGSVLSFLPIIVTLFFFLSLMEDSGYVARVAFVMDKLLRKIGLSGRSIVPMLIGFGCTVPASLLWQSI